MKKTILFFFAALCGSTFANEVDSLQNIHLEQVQVYSHKATDYVNAPISTTIFSNEKLESAQVGSIKELNGMTPNFYIPDYGSAMSNAVYIRGIGSRNSGQSMTLYLDNVPYLDKSAFDFNFFDISQLEVLRGPQGTLYGRNALGGIVNIYTLSPLRYQGNRLSVSGGNHGLFAAKASTYHKLNDKFGIAAGGHYSWHSGFYRNLFDGKYADAEQRAGGRLKAVWQIQPNWHTEYSSNLDFVKQGAFPYGLYNAKTGKTATPNTNAPSNYTRTTLNNSVITKFSNEDLSLTATLSHQYLKDQMNMDQDYSPAAVFEIQQNQKMNMVNAEIFLKSNTSGNHRWEGGINFFTQRLDMYVPVRFKKDGIATILQPQFSQKRMIITSPIYEIPGWYDNRTTGAAAFYQSTFNNLLIRGLSLTLGARLDREQIRFDYKTNASLDVTMPDGSPYQFKSDMEDVMKQVFTEFSPKLALKYEWGKDNFAYASVAKGYKSGGFNVQAISDLMNQKLMASGSPGTPVPDVRASTLYKPEYSLNYELGGQNMFFDRRLRTQLTLFYMDVTGLQLTQFIKNGTGRELTNAGKANSFGGEFAINALFNNGLIVGASYGYAHADFTHYKKIETIGGKPTEVDYAGKFVPYAPQHTVGANINYTKNFNNGFIDKFYAALHYNGMGKIYWNENNDLSEPYYQLINGKVGVCKGVFGVEIWGKNLLNEQYNTFYFKSFGSTFFQQGKPVQFGATLKVEL